MAERFQGKQGIRQVQIGTGTAGAVRSLADRLESFKQVGAAATQVGLQEHRIAATKRGVESAAQVPLTREGGVTQAPEFKEETFFGGIEARAHNKALRAAYLASIDNDNREQVNTIFQTNRDNLIGFNEAFEGYKRGVLKGVDPLVRQEAQINLDRAASFARQKVQTNEIQKQQNAAKQALTSNIDSATTSALSSARNGDQRESADAILKAFETLDAGVEAGYWTAQEALGQKRLLEKGTTEQLIMNEVDTLANTSIKSAFDKIDDLAAEVPKGFTPDEWRSFIIEAQQDVSRKNARMMNDLKGVRKQIQKQESIDRGIKFTNPEIPADPAKGSQDRKDVNAAYEAQSPLWRELPPLEQFDKNIEFIKNTGIIPDKVISGINATMRSGTPEQTFVFSKVIQEISKDPNSANILRDVPADARAVSLQINDSMEAGIDLEVATEIARKNTYGLTEPEKETIKKQMQALRVELPVKLEDKVDEFFDPSIIPFFGEEPDLNPAIQADFNVSVEKFLTLTGGNADQAVNLAFDSLKKTWGATSIGGDKRFMKYSPEVFYAVPGVGNQWMEKQFNEDMKGLGIKPKNTIITADFSTTSESEPTWPILTTDENGLNVPLFDSDGVLLRWKPDFKSTREFHELRALPEKKTKEAVQLRTIQDNFESIVFAEDPETEKLIKQQEL